MNKRVLGMLALCVLLALVSVHVPMTGPAQAG